MARKRASSYEIERRRSQLSELIQASTGATQRDLAKVLDVSVATVNRDLQHLKKEWRENYTGNVEGQMLIDLRRIETAIGSIWADVQAGNLQAIDRLLKLISARGTLLGYVSEDGSTPVGPGEIPIREVEVELPDDVLMIDAGEVIEGEVSVDE